MIENFFIPCKAIELPLNEINENSNRIKVVACVTGEWEHYTGKFHISNDDLISIKNDFENNKRDLLFDYDHKCLAYDGSSIAAGWGKSIIVNGGNLEIEVEFTPDGLKKVLNKEFRFLSPVYIIETIANRKDKNGISLDEKENIRKITLHSVALTNTPFLKELPPIINKNFYPNTQNEKIDIKGDTMDTKILCKILTCSEDDIIDTAKDTIKKNSELQNEVKALKIQNTELLNVKEKLEADIKKQNDDIAENAIKLAVANSQIRDDQKDWALSLYKKDKELYNEFVKANSTIKAPQQNLNIPNNQNNATITYHDLLKDAKLMSEYQKNNETLYEKLREDYYNSGGA